MEWEPRHHHPSHSRNTEARLNGDPAHAVRLTCIGHLQTACKFLAQTTFPEKFHLGASPRWGTLVLASGDRVTEQPVGRLQGSDHGTAKRILIRQVAAEQSALTLTLSGKNADDDYVGVEGAHLFDTDQFELECPARKLFDGPQGRLGSEAHVSQRAGNSFGPSDDRVSWLVLKLHFRCATGRVRAYEGKARKSKSFTTRATCRGPVVESARAKRKV